MKTHDNFSIKIFIQTEKPTYYKNQFPLIGRHPIYVVGVLVYLHIVVCIQIKDISIDV